MQSQVPRAPFLAASSRLPGVSYATVARLFDDHHLVKASLLRGTVHTTTATAYAAVDAVSRATRARSLGRALGLTTVSPDDVTAEIERFCADGWRSRDEVVTHVRGWLAEADPGATAAIGATAVDNFLWGHSGLLRRPADGAWEKRTDTYRRTARTVIDSGELAIGDALPPLVARHLAAYGPVLREDLVFFFGASISAINAAVAALGARVVRLPGPDREDYLDLAEPPLAGEEEPGVRLLPEFDGLLLGFAGRNRTRFVNEQQLGLIWAKVNGLFAPIVLHEGRVVATWKTVGSRERTLVEVTMVPPYAPLRSDLLDRPVADTAHALDLRVVDVAVRAS